MAHRYTVNEVYRSVIADVIDRVRGEFVADGVAESVLDDLRTRWEAKLRAGGAEGGGGAGPSTAAPTSDVGLPAPTVGGGGAGGVDAAAASLAPLPLPLNPLPDLPPAGDGRPVRAKRARRDAGAGLPQVDGSADDRASAGAGPAPQSPSGGAGPSGGVTAEPAAAEAAAGGGEGGPDDFADIPTSSDDEDGGGRGRGAARRSGSGGGGEDDGGGCAALRGDLLLATFDKVVRTRNRWRCVLRKAVLRLGGAEHFFDSIAGDMTF